MPGVEIGVACAASVKASDVVCLLPHPLSKRGPVEMAEYDGLRIMVTDVRKGQGAFLSLG